MRSTVLVVLLVVGIGNCAGVFAQANSIGLFAAGQYTKPARGYFPGQKIYVTQELGSTAPGRAAEYCRQIRNEVVCLGYIRTPTLSHLISENINVAWPVTDTDFELRLKFPLRKDSSVAPLNFLPYLAVGTGAILLNGGTTYKQDPRRNGSGLNGQGDILAGAGFDRRLSRSFGFRADVTVVGLQQSGFSDGTYRPPYTCKVQETVGLVRYWGGSSRTVKK